MGLPWLKKKDTSKHRNQRVYRDRIRPEKLRKDPYCEICIANGRLKEAKEVDHIKPTSEGGSPYDFDNLQSLCRQCHVKKTAEENRERMKNAKGGVV